MNSKDKSILLEKLISIEEKRAEVADIEARRLMEIYYKMKSESLKRPLPPTRDIGNRKPSY